MKSNKISKNVLLVSILIMCIVAGSLYIYKFKKNVLNVKKLNIEKIEKNFSKEENNKFLSNLKKWNYKFFLNYSGVRNIISLKSKDKFYVLLWLLNYANYYYDSSIVDKVLKMVNNDSLGLYSWCFLKYIKWYAYELKKSYKKSIREYLKAYSLCKDKEIKSYILSQLWHVYDLWWDMKKAYFYYDKAYTLNKSNLHAILNLWRYFVRKKNYSLAENFFKKALSTENKAFKSEIYFSLSSLKLISLEPDIEKSIYYAKKSIDAFSGYSMWYVALARWYYMYNNWKYDKLIEDNLIKAIKIYSGNYLAYYFLALHLYDLWRWKDASKLLFQAYNVVDRDVRLMDNERKSIKVYLQELNKCLLFLNYCKKNKYNDIMLIKDIFLKNLVCKDFLLLQLKRNNYWVFKWFKNINKFVKLYVLNKNKKWKEK